MLIDFKRKAHQKIRIWVDELPNIPPSQRVRYADSLPAIGREVAKKRSAAIELVHPIGGMIQYGLLGAEIHPGSHDFRMSVCAIEEAHEVYTESMLSKNKDVYVGLYSEFAQSVFDGFVQQALLSKHRPAGVMTCNIAACDAVGSSRDVFNNLARDLMRILLMPSYPTKEQIAHLLNLSS